VIAIYASTSMGSDGPGRAAIGPGVVLISTRCDRCAAAPVIVRPRSSDEHEADGRDAAHAVSARP
jgi:hypothetical protein